MKTIERRLSQVERMAAKTQAVTVSYIGREKGVAQMDLLQAVQSLLARKIHNISIQMTPEEMQTTLSETALYIENYIKEKQEAWQ